jgi:peptide/nickel transport system substrate-binding protein
MAILITGCDLSGWLSTDADSLGATNTRDPETLVVARPSDARELDPALPFDNESIEVIDQMYERLVRWNPSTSSLDPGLATSWEVQDGGRQWTFHLRTGVRFHDGTPLNADAVVFSLERQRDPRHPFHSPQFQYWQNQFRNIIKVDKVDDLTVRIAIERPYAPFEANMAMFPVSIVSPTAVARWGADFTSHPSGTGPFMLERWDRGDRIVLRRNDDYWDADHAAVLARVVFQVIEDPRQRLIALESGAVDVATQILPEELQFVDLHPGLQLHETPSNSVTYLAMNNDHPPFDDVEVRRAVNYAINKEPIVKLAYQGLAIAASGPLPPTQWGYHKVRAQYPYDPDQARALLGHAQAEGRFDPTRVYKLYVPSTPRPYLFDPARVARVIQANLAAVGLRTELVLQPYSQHQQATRRGEHDLCLFGWVGDNGDPDNFLFLLFDRDNTVIGSAQNAAFYRDVGVHDLLAQAQTSQDRAERERLYAQVQERIAEDAPWVPLAHSQVAIAARTDVGSVIVNPNGHLVYARIRRIRR